jgi:cation diffusion facilitator CzcD-associated flavoprotein CzcO
VTNPDIAIIGTGFGGIGMAIRLKRAGIHNFVIYSKASAVGGVWRDNSYPGACCDVPSALYSFSFDHHYDWSRTHGMRDEIAAYLEACVERYGLAPHITYDTEIRSAEFDEHQATWHLRSTDGREFAAHILVSACGLFNQPSYPDIDGLDGFAGTQFHSARWNHGYDLSGKRVAVIGTGCSAAQFIPEIVGTVARLVLFARTPQFVMPKLERNFTAAERERFRRFPFMRTVERLRTYIGFERRFQLQVSAGVRKGAEQGALAFLDREVGDPVKRAKLTPTYRFGCKRMIQSNTYLAALNRANVEIETTPIARILPQGIMTQDGTMHEVDAIILGTGFKPADYLAPMRVTGLGGRALADAWRRGAEAYLGITVSGFPNFFMIYGPNTNTFNSIIVMIEAQNRYILKCIKRLVNGRARMMNVRAEVQAGFNEEVQRALAGTVWGSGCRSYFVGSQGRVVTQWPKPSRFYRWLTRKLNGSDYVFTP